MTKRTIRRVRKRDKASGMGQVSGNGEKFLRNQIASKAAVGKALAMRTVSEKTA